MSLILNKSQAESVYSAMCALNNVNARVQVSGLDDDGLEVRERADGAIVIGYLVDNAQRGTVLESHADQSAFATAYGLNSDEPQSAVAAAAGGLTQTAIER